MYHLLTHMTSNKTIVRTDRVIYINNNGDKTNSLTILVCQMKSMFVSRKTIPIRMRSLFCAITLAGFSTDRLTLSSTCMFVLYAKSLCCTCTRSLIITHISNSDHAISRPFHRANHNNNVICALTHKQYQSCPKQ